VVYVNYSTRQINIKIVYYGPGLSGKTTNLEYIYKKTQNSYRGELVSLNTDGERTLFFDLLPMEIGKIRDLVTKVQLYTVPGQVHYNKTRKLVLKGVDGLVFVADSQASLIDANKESFNNMVENLKSYDRSIKNIPLVFQYNKQDLSNLMPVEDLNRILNPNNYPYFASIAIQGKGVLETLRTITKKTLQVVKKDILDNEKKIELQNVEAQAKKGNKTSINSNQHKSAPGKENTRTIKMTEKERDKLKEQVMQKIKVLREKQILKDLPAKGKDEATEIDKSDFETPEKKIKEQPSSELINEVSERNLSLNIDPELLSTSSHIWINFTDNKGNIIKRWKLSKNRLKKGVNLSFNIEINTK